MPEYINFLKLWALSFVNGILLNLPGEELLSIWLHVFDLFSWQFYVPNYSWKA